MKSAIKNGPESMRELACPHCGCEALYRYGKNEVGHQRMRCIICGRDSREPVEGRPRQSL